MVEMDIKEFGNMNEEELDNFFEALELLEKVMLTDKGTEVGVLLSPNTYEGIKDML